MNSYPILDAADQQRLHAFLHNERSVPRPDASQQHALDTLLQNSQRTGRAAEFLKRIGFYDSILLAAPADADDTFEFEIVLPGEANVDAGRISVLSPVCLAVLGRAEGEHVSWDTPRGPREMKILSVHKRRQRSA